MKSIKAKIVYYNIIKPTFDLIELFSINPGKSISNSVCNPAHIFVENSVSNSVYCSIWNSVRNSVESSAWNSVWESPYSISNSVKRSVWNSVSSL